MVEINLKSLIIGMALGALLNSNLNYALFKTSPVFSGSSSISDDAPRREEEQQQEEVPPSSSSGFPTNTNFKPDPMFQRQYDEMDNEDMHKKCERYGLTFDPSDKSGGRRIFFGSMVANDAIQVLQMHATEVYGLYDVIVFSESNTTHMATPRQMRFLPGKQAHDFVFSGVFGPKTKIHMSYWLEDYPNLRDMPRERTQRNTIVQGWIEQGMTENDIGIMSDMDETFTRDYLLAMKHCVPPPEMVHRNCKKPKLLGNSLVFQSSPECISQKAWYHPDWMFGHCIEGVAKEEQDPDNKRVPRKRDHFLAAACGGGNYCSDGRENLYDDEQITKNGLYPLSSGTDIRELPQGNMVMVNVVDDKHTNTAYHFHNMFADLVQLRDKYATYAHGSASIAKRPLGLIELDLDIAVRCAHDYPNDLNPDGRPRWTEGFESFKGSKPVYFANETYRQERHSAFKQMMKEDEEIWGKTFNDSFVEQFYARQKN